MEILYTAKFLRLLGDVEPALEQEIYEKIDLFKHAKNHRTLKVHKLKGKLSGRYAFSVNYRIRVVFSYSGKNTAIFLALGDHDLYK
jgi:plasmid maintenance system killer protein